MRTSPLRPIVMAASTAVLYATRDGHSHFHVVLHATRAAAAAAVRNTSAAMILCTCSVGLVPGGPTRESFESNKDGRTQRTTLMHSQGDTRVATVRYRVPTGPYRASMVESLRKHARKLQEGVKRYFPDDFHRNWENRASLLLD